MARMHMPESLGEAVELLDSLEDAMVYGGGTAIQILRKQGILFTEDFVDLSRVAELRDIDVSDTDILVGAMVSVRQMETDARVRQAIPLASQVYGNVANPRVRNTASVGGNIAHGDYRLDPPTALLVLDATVLISSVRGTRELPIREFFVDFQVTDVGDDEMISGIRIPVQPKGAPGQFVKFSSLSVNDWPCASVAALAVDEDCVLEMRLGVGALAPTSLYLAYDLEPGMNEQAAVDAAIDIVNSAMDPIADIRGSSGYKARVGRVIVEEAVRTVMKELQHA